MATTSTKQRQDMGARLRLERERLGYEPRQIAQLLGVPLDVYERFEKGVTRHLPHARLAAWWLDVLT